MKLNRILAIVVALVTVMALSVTMIGAANPDVVMDFVKGATTNNKEGPNGFFGPYTGKADGVPHATLDATDGLVFDTSLTDAYVTSEVNPQEMGMRKYAVLVIKTDNPSGIEGFTMTFGGAGKPWNQFKDADGKTVPELTTEYQTVCIDLTASLGISSVPSDEGTGADFAMNKGVATAGKIYIKTITFTDTASGANTTTVATTTKSGGSNNDTTAAATTSNSGATTVATTVQNSTTKDKETGVAGTVSATVVAGIALAGIALTLKKKSK